MALFLNNNNAPTKINGLQISQSKQGYCIPVVMGARKIQQSLMWCNSLDSQLVNTPSAGGGKGGGKHSGQEYLYSADVIVALAEGPLLAVGNVWSGQTWLASNYGSELITLTYSVYTPNFAKYLVAKNGVAIAVTYSGSYADYGAPVPTILSGSSMAPMTEVPYGAPLTPTTYSVDPTSIGTFAVTSCAIASGGSTVYTGTFTGGTAPYTTGDSGGYCGFAFTVVGFVTAVNNGTFQCTASSATTLTLNNTVGVAETSVAEASSVGNTYHFDTSAIGKSIEVSYQYSLVEFQAQEVDLINGSPIFPGGSNGPQIDHGVIYYNNGTSQDGQALTQVTGTPAQGEYNFTSNNTSACEYDFSSADVGFEVLISWGYENLNAVSAPAPTTLNFILYGGTKGQSPAEYLYSTTQALGYTNIGYLLFAPMSLGTSAQIQDNVFEVLTPHYYGGGILDANPILCILEVLTNNVWGLGSGLVPFPFECIDISGESAQPGTSTTSMGVHAGGGGGYNTWVTQHGLGILVGQSVRVSVTGDPTKWMEGPCTFYSNTTGTLTLGGVSCQGGGTYSTWNITPIQSGTWGIKSATLPAVSSTSWAWFASQNFFISPLLDSQDSAASVIGKWLEAGMCAAYFSEGLLKLVPYGDTSTSANGLTWKAPSSSVVSLDDTCFVAKYGEDPVKIERSAYQDASNKVQVQFSNRLNQYADDIVSESDQAAIDRYGLRLEDPQSYDFICTLPAAQFSASMRVKRSVNIRNTYSFVLPFSYSFLEPMDLCNLTTTSQWAAGENNVQLAILNQIVRVTKIVDDPIIGLEITCEDYLWGVHQPSIYNKDLSSGDRLVNAFAHPGNSDAVMFEAPYALTLAQGNVGNQIWVGVNGASTDWGSCNVWVSQDENKYLNIGNVPNPARLGVTETISFGVTADPDTTTDLVVKLIGNSAPLESGTTLDADSGTTLCWVGGEIISYSTCTLTGPETFTMSGSYIRRGQKTTNITTHLAGTQFLRLDQSVLKYTYDPTWIGTTLYFKFQSVNRFGNMAQDLNTITPIEFTVAGNTVHPVTALAAVSGLAASLTQPNGMVIPRLELTWAEDDLYVLDGGHIEVQMCPHSLASPPVQVWQSVPLYSGSTTQAFLNVITGASYDVRVRAIRSNGAQSTWVEQDNIFCGVAVSATGLFAVAPPGTLSATSSSLSVADIIVPGFVATIPGFSTTVTLAGIVFLYPVHHILLAAVPQNFYWVYYQDDNFNNNAGAGITPIATQSSADFENVPGRFMIGSILTPPYGAPRVYPSTYSSQGTYSVDYPTLAFDGDLGTSSLVTGLINGTYTSGAFGECLWYGFPSITAAPGQSIVVTAIALDYGGAAQWAITVAMGGGFKPSGQLGTLNNRGAWAGTTSYALWDYYSQAGVSYLVSGLYGYTSGGSFGSTDISNTCIQLAFGTGTVGSTTYTATLPASLNLSTISVDATVNIPPGTSSNNYSTVVWMTEIFVQ